MGIVLVIAGMTFAAYKLLLTNEARRNLRETGSSLARGYYALLDMLVGLVGLKTDLDQLEANRRQIQQDWNAWDTEGHLYGVAGCHLGGTTTLRSLRRARSPQRSHKRCKRPQNDELSVSVARSRHFA